MTLIAAKWTIDDYHQMIAAGILCDRQVELLKGEIIEIRIKLLSNRKHLSCIFRNII